MQWTRSFLKHSEPGILSLSEFILIEQELFAHLHSFLLLSLHSMQSQYYFSLVKIQTQFTMQVNTLDKWYQPYTWWPTIYYKESSSTIWKSEGPWWYQISFKQQCMLLCAISSSIFLVKMCLDWVWQHWPLLAPNFFSSWLIHVAKRRYWKQHSH